MTRRNGPLRRAFCVSAPAPCYKGQVGATVPLRGCTGILLQGLALS